MPCPSDHVQILCDREDECERAESSDGSALRGSEGPHPSSQFFLQALRALQMSLSRTLGYTASFLRDSIGDGGLASSDAWRVGDWRVFDFGGVRQHWRVGARIGGEGMGDFLLARSRARLNTGGLAFSNFSGSGSDGEAL